MSAVVAVLLSLLAIVLIGAFVAMYFYGKEQDGFASWFYLTRHGKQDGWRLAPGLTGYKLTKGRSSVEEITRAEVAKQMANPALKRQFKEYQQSKTTKTANWVPAWDNVVKYATPESSVPSYKYPPSGTRKVSPVRRPSPKRAASPARKVSPARVAAAPPKAVPIYRMQRRGGYQGATRGLAY